jgi:hypothetical protein
MPAKIRGGAGDGQVKAYEIVIPSEARDLQFAAKCRSLASLGMTTQHETDLWEQNCYD